MDLFGITGNLLAESERRRVLQVRSTDLDDMSELLLLPLERRVEALKSWDQMLNYHDDLQLHGERNSREEDREGEKGGRMQGSRGGEAAGAGSRSTEQGAEEGRLTAAMCMADGNESFVD